MARLRHHSYVIYHVHTKHSVLLTCNSIYYVMVTTVTTDIYTCVYTCIWRIQYRYKGSLCPITLYILRG